MDERPPPSKKRRPLAAGLYLLASVACVGAALLLPEPAKWTAERIWFGFVVLSLCVLGWPCFRNALRIGPGL